jgi:hypothetical protein
LKPTAIIGGNNYERNKKLYVATLPITLPTAIVTSPVFFAARGVKKISNKVNQIS